MSGAKKPATPRTSSRKTQEMEIEPAGAYAKADTSTVPLEKRIGNVIKQRRLSANLTLAQLGDGAGMSSAMLSRVENGMATASLDSLERLCIALGMTMGDLFNDSSHKAGKAQLIKKDEQMEVVRVGTKQGYSYHLLSYDRGPRKIFEPFLVEVNQNCKSWPRFSHPGTELIYMLHGRLEYRFGDLIYLLETGDSLTFSGNVLHGPEKMLSQKARFLSIIIYSDEDR